MYVSRLSSVISFDFRMKGDVYIFEPNNIPLLLRAGRSGDRMPLAAKFSVPNQTGPEAHPTSYTMGTGSFPGGKAAGAWR